MKKQMINSASNMGTLYWGGGEWKSSPGRDIPGRAICKVLFYRTLKGKCTYLQAVD